MTCHTNQLRSVVCCASTSKNNTCTCANSDSPSVEIYCICICICICICVAALPHSSFATSISDGSAIVRVKGAYQCILLGPIQACNCHLFFMFSRPFGNFDVHLRLCNPPQVEPTQWGYTYHTIPYRTIPYHTITVHYITLCYIPLH